MSDESENYLISRMFTCNNMVVACCCFDWVLGLFAFVEARAEIGSLMRIGGKVGAGLSRQFTASHFSHTHDDD